MNATTTSTTSDCPSWCVRDAAEHAEDSEHWAGRSGPGVPMLAMPWWSHARADQHPHSLNVIGVQDAYHLSPLVILETDLTGKGSVYLRLLPAEAAEIHRQLGAVLAALGVGSRDGCHAGA
jgi:hypothetical protein